MATKKNIGIRLNDEVIEVLEERSRLSGIPVYEICRSEIASYLGLPIEEPIQRSLIAINARLERTEQMMLEKSSENALQGASNLVAVGLRR